jgi:chromosome segregation ATPase
LDVFSGTWAEYVEVRSREVQESEVRQAKDKWTEDQRQARREEQRARRDKEARQQQADELEVEIHHLEEQLKTLQQEITGASEAQEAMRIHELGTIYDKLENQLQEHLDQWAELAG